MSDVKIDPQTFRRRLHVLQKNIGSTTDSEFKDADGLLVMVGSSDDYNPYQKSTVLHNWLLGYEFPATGMWITAKKIVFVTSAGKAKYLAPLVKLGGSSYTMKILQRSKDPEHNKQLFHEFVDEIGEGATKKVGVLPKDHYKGKFMEEWEPIWSDKKGEFDEVDASLGLSKTLEVKDEEEQRSLRVASRASTNLMTYFTDEMSKIIDEDLNVTNAQLVDRIEAKIDDPKFFKKMESDKSMKKLGANFDLNNLDWCYKPIVQSNGKYELKFSVESNKDKLGGHIIMASLGMRYKSYCSNVTRTFLIAPSKEMEKNYDFLLRLHNMALSMVRDGAVANDVYNSMLDHIRKERPELEGHFIKNMGSLIGIDFRDSNGVLNGKNARRINEGAVVNIVLGLQGLHDDKLGDYGLMVADTIRITGEEPILLTDSPLLRKDVAFYFEDEANEEEGETKVKTEAKTTVKKEKKQTPVPATSSMANTRVLKAKQRAEQKSAEDDQMRIQQDIQTELRARLEKEGLERFNPEDANDNGEQKAVFKKYESYVRDSQIPNNVRDLKIHIDSKNQTIILPICGRPVPFHINAYKNGSKSEEGDYTNLRLNFNYPGVSASRKLELPYETGDDKQFIRSLTFRSKDGPRMNEVLKMITEMKKEAVKRENQKKEMADVVSQASLVEVSRPRRLDNVFLRPTPDSKRFPGFVAIHQNGIRYQSFGRGDHRVDILFSNIKHLFFQSCKGELLVIIHCHLKTPLMIGKKKTYDVQFYREAIDASIDETGSRKRKYRYGDEDELEQEQEERRRRAALDKEFKQYAEHIADGSHGLVDLDVPFRELGFQGVPSRSAVQCLPTRDCLVQLIDLPFLVITLAEVEIAHLERVQFGLKNFDMVFVYKDFSKPVTHISTIQMENLEDVKAWLTDVDIPYGEGAVNLNWPTIMKTIQADPYEFFEQGGWSFLYGSEDDESGSEESEAESDFAPTDEEPEDDEDDYSDSDSDEDEEADDDDDFDDADDDVSESDIADSDNVSEEEFSD